MSDPAPPPGFRWLWLDSIDERRQRLMTDMLQRVLERDDTVGFPGPLPPAEATAVVRDLGAAVAAGQCLLLVAENDDCVAGQCVLTPSTAPNQRHIGWISRTMVDPSLRGIGLVRHGVPRLLDKAEEVGLDLLGLDVRAGVPAEQMWQHLGFRTFGRLPDYARVRGQSLEGVYMVASVAELRERHRLLARR